MKLQDLARELNLSLTTVSRALNGYSEVNENTRRRVQRAAKAARFFPNANAKALAQHSPDVVAVVVSVKKYLDPDFMDMLDGLSEALSSPLHDILLTPCDKQGFLESCRSIVETQRAAGIILFRPTVRDDSISFLAKARLPFVVLGNSDSPVQHNWLDVDHRQTAYSAASYLFERGHENSVSLEGDYHASATRWRLCGLRKAQRQFNKANDTIRVIHDDLSDDFGYNQMRRLLCSGQPFSAMIFYSIKVAEGAIRAANEVGVDRRIQFVTHDSQVPCFGKSLLPGSTAFTTFSIRNVGIKLGQEIIRAIKQPGIFQCETLQPKFVLPQTINE